MAEPGSSPLSRSPSSSRPTSRPGTPSRDSGRGPPPLPASPSKSPSKSSSLKSTYLGLDSQNPIQRITGDYLLSGTHYERPPEVSNSNLASNVAADSSSIAALDARVNQENLKQEIMPSSACLEARVALEKTSAAAKYGAHTGSASDSADVRWYFCKTPLRPNEAAAQVPASEVVGKGEYFRFSLRDSLSLEASFVQREEELVSAWWKEYAEVSAGPTKSSGTLSSTLQIEKETEEKFGSLNSPSDKRAGKQGPGSTHSDEDDDEESVGVLVKGGLYEVDLMRRRCIPVYWRGEHRRVLRGHWYVRKGGLDWLPLREDVAEQLEIAYHKKIWRRRQFQPSGLYAARVNLTGTTMGLHALFTGEDDNWEATLAVDASGISAILGLQGSGVKLRRGFAPPDSINPTQDELRQKKEEQLDDYASQVPVRHVVFMVHGIGQRLEKANLVDDVGAFRQTVTALSEQHLTPHQLNAQRILFIPCQWRRELKLGGEVAMEQVTLDGVRALRTMITATVHDVLYYMSPVYCQDIIDSVTRSLNRLYTRFIKRNPSFDGKVSLYGHSLGSVLTYDILCHQDTLKSPFPVQSINAAITRNDDCEDDMPKIDRLPSSLENELIPEGGTSDQEPLSSVNNLQETSHIISTVISENELIPEVEAAESEDATAAEGVTLDPHETKNIAVLHEDQDALLRNVFSSEVGDMLKDEISREHTEISEDASMTEFYFEIPEETNIAKSHSEVSDEDELAKEDSKILMQDDDTKEYTQTSQEHADASEEFQALEIKNPGNENEDAGVDSNIIMRESLQDLEGANFEIFKSDEPQNARLQDTEQEDVQDMPDVEVKKALDDLDQVIVDSVEDNKEISEIDRLKAKVSALEEKLRLEIENRVHHKLQETLEDFERSGPSMSCRNEDPQGSTGSVEAGKSQHGSGENCAELRQSTPDIDFGNVKGKLEPVVSARKQHRPFIIYPKLKFKVETFYAVGSPLGMFLALRNIRIGLGTGTEYWQDEGIDEEMPACRLLLNIFHPYDPVAYRLEPLVCKEFVDHKPVFIPYHKGGKRIHIGLQEFGEDISMKSKAFVNSISAVGTRVAYACTSKKDESLKEEEEKERNRKKPKTYGQMVMERLTGSPEGRVDCMLQDATFEHQYISAISSHTSYWQDPDTALFILRHLYRDIPEEPESENVTTEEALDETIADSDTTENLFRDLEAQDDWDSGDDDSSSLFFSKEDFVALLETDQAKPTPNQKV